MKNDSSQKANVLKNWSAFINHRQGYKNKKIKWTLADQPYTMQRDSYNCGVFVCKYVHNLLLKENLILEDNINDFRKQIKQEIISVSKKV